MDFHSEKEPPFLTYTLFRAFSSIKHFVSTRQGGTSQAPFSSLNLSLRHDNPDRVLANREALAKVLHIPSTHFCWPEQVHGAEVTRVGAQERGKGGENIADSIPHCDALITNEKNVCLVVSSADCVPLLFYDPRQQAIGAAHAGWRGTVQKMALRTLQAMQREFGSKAEDIYVGLGPCIHQEKYEVGPEVEEAVRDAFGTEIGYLSSNQDTGKKHFDLVYANLSLLDQAGVPSSQIEVSPYCTYQNEDLFFSYRRDGGPVGIFASGIMLSDN